MEELLRALGGKIKDLKEISDRQFEQRFSTSKHEDKWMDELFQEYQKCIIEVMLLRDLLFMFTGTKIEKKPEISEIEVEGRNNLSLTNNQLYYIYCMVYLDRENNPFIFGTASEETTAEILKQAKEKYQRDPFFHASCEAAKKIFIDKE
jgi:hypothetical protein